MVRDTKWTHQLVESLNRASCFYFRTDDAGNVEPAQPGFSGEHQPNTRPNRSTNPVCPTNHEFPIHRGCLHGTLRPVTFIYTFFSVSLRKDFWLIFFVYSLHLRLFYYTYIFNLCCLQQHLQPFVAFGSKQPAFTAFWARHHCAHRYHPIDADAAACSTTFNYERRKPCRAGWSLFSLTWLVVGIGWPRE